MKFKIKSYEQHILDNEHWNAWFAWYPVRVSGGEIVWFEIVARKVIWNGYNGESCETWKYRKIEEDETVEGEKSLDI